MGDSAENVKVVFIGGESRSGSTLLDLMLGQLEGFFSAGELRYIWERGFQENHLCGCGKQICQCEFWSQVVEEAFGSFEKMDIKTLCVLWNTVERTWYTSLFPFLIGTNSYKKKFIDYIQVLRKLYKAIHKVSGKRIIVDSSKKPFHGLILNATPDIELYTIHLIRDCRAVAYSWQRLKTRPEIYWKEEHMPIVNPAYTATSWNIRNSLMDILKYVNRHYTVVQYEALASNPHEVLTNILAYLQESIPPPGFLSRLELHHKVQHTVAGNPMRFQRGSIAVRPDIEWQRKMSKRQRLLTTVLSWPLLLKYGYIKRMSLLPSSWSLSP